MLTPIATTGSESYYPGQFSLGPGKNLRETDIKENIFTLEKTQKNSTEQIVAKISELEVNTNYALLKVAKHDAKLMNIK